MDYRVETSRNVSVSFSALSKLFGILDSCCFLPQNCAYGTDRIIHAERLTCLNGHIDKRYKMQVFLFRERKRTSREQFRENIAARDSVGLLIHLAGDYPTMRNYNLKKQRKHSRELDAYIERVGNKF